MRVLIVDDSKTARIVCRKALPPELTSDLIEAAGGREALEICRSRQIDLMFLDLTMPEVDGFAVLEQLQGDPARPRIVVMSADVQTKAQERVKALGAFAFIGKPATSAAVTAMLKELGL
jgi:two-component system, chemotaxis family, chemotaxis protein CheY